MVHLSRHSNPFPYISHHFLLFGILFQVPHNFIYPHHWTQQWALVFLIMKVIFLFSVNHDLNHTYVLDNSSGKSECVGTLRSSIFKHGLSSKEIPLYLLTISGVRIGIKTALNTWNIPANIFKEYYVLGNTMIPLALSEAVQDFGEII